MTIQASGNNLVYTPKAGFIGTETFTYTISDRTSGGLTSTATVTVNVGTNAPTAVNDSFTVAEDAAAADFNLVANDSTSDPGETISVSAIATPSAGGTATLLSNGTGINYKPKANFSGTETIVYTLRDSSGATAQATVTFTVTGVNDAPTAVADAITVSKGSTATTISVLSNDTDPDTNDTLRVSAVGTASSGGTVTISSDGKSVLYTPPSATFTGTDTFTYTLSDAANSTSTATVTVTVADYVPRSIAIDVNGVNSSGNFRFMSGLTFTGTNSLGQAVNLTATPDSTGLATFTNLAPGTYTASLGTLPFLIGGSSTMTITSSATDGNSTNNSLNTGNLNPKYISLRDFSTATPEQSVLVALKAGQTATWMFLANDLGGLTNPTITLSSDVKTLTLRGTKNGQTQQATLNIGTDAAQLRGQEGDFYLLRVSTNTGVTFTPVPAGSGEPGSANSSTANSSTVAFNPATAASASSNRSTAAGEPDIDAALGLNSSLVISGSGDGVYATESLLSDSNESVGTTSPSTSGNQVLPFTSSNDDNEDEDDQDLTDAVDSIFSQLA